MNEEHRFTETEIRRAMMEYEENRLQRGYVRWSEAEESRQEVNAHLERMSRRDA